MGRNRPKNERAFEELEKWIQDLKEGIRRHFVEHRSQVTRKNTTVPDLKRFIALRLSTELAKDIAKTADVIANPRKNQKTKASKTPGLDGSDIHLAVVNTAFKENGVEKVLEFPRVCGHPCKNLKGQDRGDFARCSRGDKDGSGKSVRAASSGRFFGPVYNALLFKLWRNFNPSRLYFLRL